VSDEPANASAPLQSNDTTKKGFLGKITAGIIALTALVGAVYGLWQAIQQFAPKHEVTSSSSSPGAGAAIPALTTAKTVTKETATATPVSTSVSSAAQPEWVLVNPQQELEDFPTEKSPDGQWHEYTFVSTFLKLPYQPRLKNPHATADRQGEWDHSNFNPEMHQGDPVVVITPDGLRVSVSYKTCVKTSFTVRIWADVYRPATSK
jgi:hypothetical protein